MRSGSAVCPISFPMTVPFLTRPVFAGAATTAPHGRGEQQPSCLPVGHATTPLSARFPRFVDSILQIVEEPPRAASPDPVVGRLYFDEDGPRALSGVVVTMKDGRAEMIDRPSGDERLARPDRG